MFKDTMALRKKILFTIGSPNQTSQMHQIAAQLSDYDCYFSQLYSKHPIVRLVQRTGLLDTTILAGEFKRKGDAYLERHQLRNDYARGIYNNSYDLVLMCSDLLVTGELRKMKTVWVRGRDDRSYHQLGEDDAQSGTTRLFCQEYGLQREQQYLRCLLCRVRGL
ncbi:hypothetical protein ACQ86N_10090 [Puia sp. P3]|uniref:hypothetical protein n=1 Tax=Puia sp. P3 TaxID=3423952 RepID=UPI003D667973